METAFTAIACLMLVCTILQASLIPDSRRTSDMCPRMISTRKNKVELLMPSFDDHKSNGFSPSCRDGDDKEIFSPVVPILLTVSDSTDCWEFHHKVE